MGADPYTAGFLMVGTAFQMYGQYEANKQQAQAERVNQKFLLEQQKLIEAATRRESDIYKRESELFIGEKVSLFARGGVTGGEITMEIARDKAAAGREGLAIKSQGDLRADMAGLRAGEAGRTADTLSGSALNNRQMAGSMINLGTGLAIAGSRNQG